MRVIMHRNQLLQEETYRGSSPKIIRFTSPNSPEPSEEINLAEDLLPKFTCEETNPLQDYNQSKKIVVHICNFN
jgi:hypothetical protein